MLNSIKCLPRVASDQETRLRAERVQQLLQQSPDSAPTHVLMGEALDGLGRTPRRSLNLKLLREFLLRNPTSISDSATSTGSRTVRRSRKEIRDRTCARSRARSVPRLSRRHQWKNNHADAALPLLQVRSKPTKISYRLCGPGRDLLQQKNYKEGEADFKGRRARARPARRALPLGPSVPGSRAKAPRQKKNFIKYGNCTKRRTAWWGRSLPSAALIRTNSIITSPT